MNKFKIYFKDKTHIIISAYDFDTDSGINGHMWVRFYNKSGDAIGAFNMESLDGWAEMDAKEVKEAEEMERKIEEFKERFTGEVIPDRVAGMIINKLEGDQ